jgi:glycerophosphoryl diester phosphodiesterase
MSDVLSWIRLPGPFLIGHRGQGRSAPENTPAAFEAALEAGCDGVELDVRCTADGVPVVHHDAEVRGERGTESAVIEETAAEELLAGRWRDGKGRPYTVPTLAAVLDVLARRALVNVEVKPPPEGRGEATVEAVREALERARPRESILVSSFDPRVLEMFRARDASLLLGFLFASLGDLNRMEQESIMDGLNALHPRHDLVDRNLMKRAEERGLAVHTWTVNERREAERLLDLGVASLITDAPEAVGPALGGE